MLTVSSSRLSSVTWTVSLWCDLKNLAVTLTVFSCHAIWSVIFRSCNFRSCIFMSCIFKPRDFDGPSFSCHATWFVIYRSFIFSQRHRLAECNETWHDEGHLCVVSTPTFVNFDPLFLLSTFPRAQIFDNEYLAHFLSKRNEIWQL